MQPLYSSGRMNTGCVLIVCMFGCFSPATGAFHPILFMAGASFSSLIFFMGGGREGR
jgi:hypothetical protein